MMQICRGIFIPAGNVNILISDHLMISNAGLGSSWPSLISWGEGASLALVGYPSSDSVTIKNPYGVDVSHRSASHPIFSYWVG